MFFRFFGFLCFFFQGARENPVPRDTSIYTVASKEYQQWT